jgi:hypothetical protein
VNWVMNTFAPGYSKRAGRLAALKVANLNVNMAGGGSGGYFSTRDFIDPNDPPHLMRVSYDTMYNYFQINIESGASCNLNDW